MALSDVLSGIGTGLEKVGKAAGTVAEPLAKGIATEEAGYAPQIAAESRAHSTAMEDQAIAVKAQELESQLEMGRKYGTLTPEQQTQYVDQITQLYSHPRHAATLMEKLRKVIHPNGAVAGPAQPQLANATPPGGTGAADASLKATNRPRPLPGVKPFKGPDGQYYQPVIDSDGKITNEPISNYAPPPEKQGGGKSPPLPGNQLPAGAMGPNGEPIPDTAKTPNQSFVEFHGEWWPVAKPKPVFKTVKGNAVLVDGQTGAILRNLGPIAGVKTTTHQTMQPGDDGQMHLVNLTSVTVPGAGEINVELSPGAKKEEGAPAPSAKPTSKPSVAHALKPAGPKPAASSGGVGGKVMPGFKTLAASKNPLFKSDLAQYTKVAEDANNKQEALANAQQAMKAPSPSSDQELIFSWVRSNVQGAGRMTQAEFKQAASIGSLPLKAQNWFALASTGKMTPELRQMMFADIQRSAQTAQAEAQRLRPNPTGAAPQAAPAGDQSDPLGLFK